MGIHQFINFVNGTLNDQWCRHTKRSDISRGLQDGILSNTTVFHKDCSYHPYVGGTIQTDVALSLLILLCRTTDFSVSRLPEVVWNDSPI